MIGGHIYFPCHSDSADLMKDDIATVKLQIRNSIILAELQKYNLTTGICILSNEYMIIRNEQSIVVIKPS